nr:ras-related protein Rab-43 isoform X3 [Equus asinus]
MAFLSPPGPHSIHVLQIWDTAGQERFRTITQSYYRSANGAILAYDITKRSSFLSVPHWIEDVRKYAGSNIVQLLIGRRNISCLTLLLSSNARQPQARLCPLEGNSQLGSSESGPHNTSQRATNTRARLSCDPALLKAPTKFASEPGDSGQAWAGCWVPEPSLTLFLPRGLPKLQP